MTWREITSQSAGLRDLAGELGERHDYAADLVRDMFLAACKASPAACDSPAEMDPSRLVNRQVDHRRCWHRPSSPSCAARPPGDPYASAMAVLAQAATIRRMLEQARDAQRAADEAAGAAQAGGRSPQRRSKWP